VWQVWLKLVPVKAKSIPTNNAADFDVLASQSTTVFPTNKDHIYFALYARGGQDPNTYYWAIIIGRPKEDVRYRLDPDENPVQH
jgi:hypothetical protein